MVRFRSMISWILIAAGMPDSFSISLRSFLPGSYGTEPADIERLLELLIEHQVLFFRDHPITPEAQARFAAHFGSLHVHPIYPVLPELPEIMLIDTHPGFSARQRQLAHGRDLHRDAAPCGHPRREAPTERGRRHAVVEQLRGVRGGESGATILQGRVSKAYQRPELTLSDAVSE